MTEFSITETELQHFNRQLQRFIDIEGKTAADQMINESWWIFTHMANIIKNHYRKDSVEGNIIKNLYEQIPLKNRASGGSKTSNRPRLLGIAMVGDGRLDRNKGGGRGRSTEGKIRQNLSRQLGITGATYSRSDEKNLPYSSYKYSGFKGNGWSTAERNQIVSGITRSVITARLASIGSMWRKLRGAAEAIRGKFQHLVKNKRWKNKTLRLRKRSGSESLKKTGEIRHNLSQALKGGKSPAKKYITVYEEGRGLGKIAHGKSQAFKKAIKKQTESLKKALRKRLGVALKDDKKVSVDPRWKLAPGVKEEDVDWIF